jgi:hypothetical protein
MLLAFEAWQGTTRRGGTYEDGTAYSLAPGELSWHGLSDPSVETNHAAVVWTGSAVLVIGGFWCTGRCAVQIFAGGGGSLYDPATNTWTRGASVPPGADLAWPAVWTGQVFIDVDLSGRLGSATKHLPLAALNPDSGHWTGLPSPPLKTGFDEPQAVWTGSALLVWGLLSEQLTPGVPR